MKRITGFCLVLAALIAGSLTGYQYAYRQITAPGPAMVGTSWHVYFSPNGGCTDEIVAEIGKATNTIRVLAYSFTSEPIARSLVEAHKRGIDVVVILDKEQRTAKDSEADFLADAGIKTLIDSRHAIAHNKVIIIDRQVVITGSFNFTKAAEEHNAENLLVIHDTTLAARYAADWQRHAEHSDRDGIAAGSKTLPTYPARR